MVRRYGGVLAIYVVSNHYNEEGKDSTSKPNRFGWSPILLELEKLIAVGVGKGKLNQIKDPTMLLYLVVGREFIDLYISPPRPTRKTRILLKFWQCKMGNCLRHS